MYALSQFAPSTINILSTVHCLYWYHGTLVNALAIMLKASLLYISVCTNFVKTNTVTDGLAIKIVMCT